MDMRTRHRAALLALALLSHLPAPGGGVARAAAPPPPPATTPAAPASRAPFDLKRLGDAADAVAGRHVAAGTTPGMTVAVARDGQVVLARGYGRADVELGVAAGPDTVYRIGSVTKQFTAAAVLRLAEAGKLALDDPITKHLPDYPAQGRRVTVRHLLNHTSGIRNYTGLDPRHRRREFRLDLSYAEMTGLFAHLPLDFEPGAQFRYTNSGYYLLGEIVGRVTGTPYAQYVERELLGPLGLRDTRYADDRRVIPNRAAGYELDGGELVNAGYVSMSVPGAAGALCSTAGDLVRWTHLLHAGRVVAPASLRQMTAPTPLPGGGSADYGFGLKVGRRHGRPAVFHGGTIDGFTAFVAHYPADGLTIAVLANGKGVRSDQVEAAVAPAALGVGARDQPGPAEDAAR